MNYTNLQECINYMLLRLNMNLSKNLKDYETRLYKNTKNKSYLIYIIIYVSSKQYQFQFIINKIKNKDEIEKLINSLFDMIEKKCFSNF